MPREFSPLHTQLGGASVNIYVANVHQKLFSESKELALNLQGRFRGYISENPNAI